MSQMLQLDALVTMLACLSTTQTNPGDLVLPLDNATAGTCPLSSLSSLTTKIQALSVELENTKQKMGTLQEQLVDLRRWGTPNTGPAEQTFGPRINLQPLIQQAAAAPAASIVSSVEGLSEAPAAPTTPQNCLMQQHGVVRIRLRNYAEPFFVFCDQKTRGGGWTVVANRNDGREDFNRKWDDYKIGFGPLTTEFFIGLEKLHQITSSEYYELLVQLEDRKQVQRYAIYDHFSIGSEAEQYRLNVLGKYQGDASDALRQHSGKKFSTQDKNNGESGTNCAVAQSSAFWYTNSCSQSNPFGLYQPLLDRDVDGYKGILWRGFLDGPKGSLKKLRMLVRPRSSGS